MTSGAGAFLLPGFFGGRVLSGRRLTKFGRTAPFGMLCQGFTVDQDRARALT
jgi:hypothetical protein